MSHIGKKTIDVKEGVTLQIADGNIVVTGPKGTLTAKVIDGIGVDVAENVITVKMQREDANLSKFFGLTRALVANMVTGVTSGFDKKLELSGVGYRAKVEGEDLVLNVGYALPVRIKPLEGTKISVEENVITVSGINKQLVGDLAAHIREVRLPDPYKGKGIKYMGEKLRRKVGKAAKAVGGK